jgi:hypothetical protein
VAIPGAPLPVVLILLLSSAFFTPPFDAARSATMPNILHGDTYVVGVALSAATTQPVQVFGYLAGASLAAINPRIALLINAVTFAASALLIRFGVQWREPALTRERRTHLLRETLDGFRLVFGTPALRNLVLLVFSSAAFAIVPEGLGAPWAAEIAAPDRRGLAQGLIMAAVPFGTILGSLAVSRLLRPAVRRRLLGPLAILTPLPLVAAILNPSPLIVALLAVVSGIAFGGFLPVANGEFVKLLPREFRARAFGVVSGGLQLLMGAAVLITGAIAAGAASVGAVVGFFSLAGVIVMLCLVRPWDGHLGARRPMPAGLPGTMES